MYEDKFPKDFRYELTGMFSEPKDSADVYKNKDTFLKTLTECNSTTVEELLSINDSVTVEFYWSHLCPICKSKYILELDWEYCFDGDYDDWENYQKKYNGLSDVKIDYKDSSGDYVYFNEDMTNSNDVCSEECWEEAKDIIRSCLYNAE